LLLTLVARKRQRYTANANKIGLTVVMAAPKGHPRYGGRQKGVRNRLTQRRQAEIAASGLDPVQYLLSVMRDETAPPDRRDRAATAVAPFTNPRLAVIDANVKHEHEVKVTLSADELRARARQAIAEAFAERPLTIEHQPRVIAGRDVAKDVEQANGKASEERDG
jgi:hypothetical protein